LKLEHEKVLSNVAFNFNLRRYIKGDSYDVREKDDGGDVRNLGRGLHSFTFQLNLSRA
jgi:hypothetical protein